MQAEFNEAQVAFAELILESQLIELDVLQAWIDQLDVAPSDMGEALIQAGLLKEYELINGLSRCLGLSLASEIELEMYAVPHPLIPRELCVELLFIPLSDEDKSPFPIAISNPLDEVGLNYISEVLGGLELKVSLSAPAHLRHEIDACYGNEEEWEAYKAQQMNEQAHDGSLESPNSDEFIEPAEQNIDQLGHQLTNDMNRPSSLPDWSSLANGDQGIEAFKHILEQG